MNELSFLDDAVDVVAPRLLGCEFERIIDDKTVRLRIVEVEAYDQSDAASHSYRGETPRTSVMLGPAGHLYVYFTYGMHYCCNIVTGPAGHGSAVLIRALEPLSGIDVLSKYRLGRSGIELTNGPAKLCQALNIDSRMNGHNMKLEPLKLIIKPRLPRQQIIQTTRIGISTAKDVNWRFYIKDNCYVSTP